MMNSVKCDSTDPGQERGVTEEGVSPAQTEWGLGGGRKGSEGWRAAAQSPSQSVTLAVTRDTWRTDWPGLSWARGQMCLHSACPVIATLLSLASPLSWASHILWQDGILRNYGNVAQMSLRHWNCDSLSHTCHAHISPAVYCYPYPVPCLPWSEDCKEVQIYRTSELGFAFKIFGFSVTPTLPRCVQLCFVISSNIAFVKIWQTEQAGWACFFPKILNWLK